MGGYMIYIIGFLAQICFSGRLLFQWILSERAKRVVSPSIFWLLSLLGSYLLFFYGWLRDDFAIILGQLISYYIYIWNLDIKNDWQKIPRPIRYVLIATPFLAIGYMFTESRAFISQFFQNEKVPLWLLVYGSLGQIVWGRLSSRCGLCTNGFIRGSGTSRCCPWGSGSSA